MRDFHLAYPHTGAKNRASASSFSNHDRLNLQRPSQLDNLSVDTNL